MKKYQNINQTAWAITMQTLWIVGTLMIRIGIGRWMKIELMGLWSIETVDSEVTV